LGQASPAEHQPCRTAGARLTAARALATDARGPRAAQAGKTEPRALFAGSQGGTVAPAGRNTYAPLSARLDLRAPAVPRPEPDHTGRSEERRVGKECRSRWGLDH